MNATDPDSQALIQAIAHALAQAAAPAIAIDVAARIAAMLSDTSTPPPAPQTVDAATLAARLGVTRGFVYEHADELGGMRLGDGPRPRLRFDLSRALEGWNARSTRSASRRPSSRPRWVTDAGLALRIYAQAMRCDTAAVSQLCALLDGNPLRAGARSSYGTTVDQPKASSHT